MIKLSVFIATCLEESTDQNHRNHLQRIYAGLIKFPDDDINLPTSPGIIKVRDVNGEFIGIKINEDGFPV